MIWLLGISKDEKREIIQMILSDFDSIKEWWTEECMYNWYFVNSMY